MVDSKQIMTYSTYSTFIITLLLLVIGIIFNIQSASQIDFVYKYGIREKSECGIEYLEYNSPNYYIYNLINGSKHLSNNMLYAFTLVKIAWFVLITGMVFVLLLDLYKISSDDYESATTIITKNIKNATRILMVILIGVYLYVMVKTNGNLFNKMRNQLNTSDIGKPITNSKDFVKMYLPSTLLIVIPLLWLLYVSNYNVESIYIETLP